MICCILAETMEIFLDLTYDYGTEDTGEYQYCLKKFGPNFEENIIEVLKQYLGPKNSYWWSIVENFFPQFDI